MADFAYVIQETSARTALKPSHLWSPFSGDSVWVPTDLVMVIIS
jgi:hypothetical protein